VGGVEVSVDGGATWRRATGRASWSYSWTPTTAGQYTIRSRAADDSGNLEAPSAGRTVTVGTTTDTTPPTISTRSPASAATGVSQTANVTVTFSEAMNASTISTSTFELRDAANTLISATVIYDATTRVATLNPSPTLAAQAVYSVRVRGGATDPRVKDVAGNAMAADSVWSFTTGGDTTPPTITARSPLAAATGVALSANVTATFSEAMTSGSINSSTFTLRDPAGNAVAGAVSYSSTTRVATLNPSGTLALSGGTVYTATVRGGTGGVTDSAGNPLATDAIWTFTTTPPVVSATVPSSGATSVSRTANITATFNGPMNASTINGTTVTLQTTGGIAIPAVVTVTTLSSGATRAVLNPNGTLSSLTTYRVTVRGGSTGVKTPTGVDLAADRTWTFTTQL
jgi:Bacterial Ig-like domain